MGRPQLLSSTHSAARIRISLGVLWNNISNLSLTFSFIYGKLNKIAFCINTNIAHEDWLLFGQEILLMKADCYLDRKYCTWRLIVIWTGNTAHEDWLLFGQEILHMKTDCYLDKKYCTWRLIVIWTGNTAYEDWLLFGQEILHMKTDCYLDKKYCTWRLIVIWAERYNILIFIKDRVVI